MASVCLYFQVHQPFRLRTYAVTDRDPFYFDNAANEAIIRKVADKCYRPATQRILDLVKRWDGRFRVAYSITGTALDQMAEWCPDVIDLFRALGATGACEFLGETSHHSLAFTFSEAEFAAQVALHDAQVLRRFGQQPVVFRNTELIYCNALARKLMETGRYRGAICEGLDRLLGYRSPNYVYRPPAAIGARGNGALSLLLKNYRLSDDIAFRFSDRQWPEWPLTADRFAKWVDRINGDGYLCNLFMDYETLGEHQWEDTGIF
jgi:alpha-amylase